MSLNDYQQYHVDMLLKTNFKKQYDLIPEEFKNNYWFERFLFNLASIYTKIKASEEFDLAKDPNPYMTENFDLSESNGNINTRVECIWNSPDCMDKNVMEIALKEDGTLYFDWIFAFINKKRGREYLFERDDIHYELAMKLSEDKKTFFVEHTTASNREKPWKCYMRSIFDNSISESYRVCEAIEIETNNILYREEFAPVVAIDPNHIKEWQKQAENIPIQLLGIDSDNVNVQEVEHHQNIKQVFAGKCTVGENTRYAICWKPDGFADKSFQESFESIVRFAAPELHLSNQLDLKEKPWLVEISGEDYNSLMIVVPKQDAPHIKKLLK